MHVNDLQLNSSLSYYHISCTISKPYHSIITHPHQHVNIILNDLYNTHVCDIEFGSVT